MSWRFRRSCLVVLVSLAFSALALSGCSHTWTDIKRGLGVEKDVPDAFDVTTNAPLAIPPDYALRPPRPGAAPTQRPTPTEVARTTVFRAGDRKLETLPAATSRSPGETALLKDAGAASAPKDIRQLINNDTRSDAGDATLVQRLLLWKSRPTNPSDQTIDPTAETERLRDEGAPGTGHAVTADQGTPATATKPATESTRPDNKGFLDWLF